MIGPNDLDPDLVERLDFVINEAIDDAEGAAIDWAALGELTGAPPIAADPALAKLVSAVEPILTEQWDAAGSAMTADLNQVRVAFDLTAKDWQVTDPNIKAAIKGASFAFSQSTLATMASRCVNAADKLRDEIEQHVFAGDPSPELQKRLRSVFGLSREKARAIALTEVSRANHAAATLSAQASEVVEGWEWLLSSDACPVCQAIASNKPFVKLGEEFDRIGNHPTYASVKHPPAHPECNCTVVARLKADFLGPVNPIPTPKTKPKPTPKPTPTPLPAPPPPPPPPPPAPAPKPADRISQARDQFRAAALRQAIGNQAAAAKDPLYRQRLQTNPLLIPPGPIQDRLKAYTVGDEKIAAILQFAAISQDRVDRLEDQKDKIVDKLNKLWNRPDWDTPPIKARIATLEAERGRLRRDIDNLYDQPSLALAELLKVGKPQLFGATNFTGKNHRGEQLGKFSDHVDLSRKVDESMAWLSSVTHQGDQSDPIERKIGAKLGMRAYCGSKKAHMGLDVNEEHPVIAHEFGHAIDDDLTSGGDPQVKRSLEFLNYRLAGEKPRKLKDIFPNSSYRDDEYGRKDHFDRAFSERSAYYVGKDYGSHSTEIMSMGIEKLWRDPVTFAREDPEYCKFVLGVLDGSLR